MPRRQIYGGREADEFRRSQDIYEDNLRDLEIAEGPEVAEIKRLLKAFYAEKTKAAGEALSNYLDKLKKDGFAASRVESMYKRACAGVAIPDVKKVVQTPSARCIRRRECKSQP